MGFCSAFLQLVSDRVKKSDKVYTFEYSQEVDTNVLYGLADQSNAGVIEFVQDINKYVKQTPNRKEL